MSEMSPLAAPSQAAESEFSRLATGAQVAATTAALERNGVTSYLVASGDDAERPYGRFCPRTPRSSTTPPRPWRPSGLRMT